jgi:conjugative transfer signal peptidase TraF
MTRRSIRLTAIAVIAALMPLTNFKPAPLLVWNGSESAPVGLYYVQPAGGLFMTTLVLAMPPEPLASSLAQAGYLPLGVPLLKRVLAVPGQLVCRHKLIISVDGVDVGAAREHDSRGRVLPAWHGCRTIADGEVFLMNWDEPASLDSRYFGPIPTSAIIGRADPLWTFGER